MTSSTYQLRCYRACTLPQFNASSRRATTLLSPTTSTASSKVCFRRSTWYSTARSNCSRSQWSGSSKAATSRARTYVQNIEDWDDVNNAIASISDVLYGPKQQRTGQRFSGKTVPRRKPIDSKRRNNTSTWKLDSRPQHKFEAGKGTCDSCDGLHLRKKISVPGGMYSQRTYHQSLSHWEERQLYVPIKPIDDRQTRMSEFSHCLLIQIFIFFILWDFINSVDKHGNSLSTRKAQSPSCL